METEFNKVVLAARIGRLVRWKALAFGLSVCERMYPVFPIFAERNGHHGVEVLRVALDGIWTELMAGRDRADLNSEAKQCMDVAPDMDDYDGLYASAAMDAACSTSILLEAMSGDHVSAAADIASLGWDTVDMLVQQYEDMDSQDPELEARILEHPLMQKELAHQRLDLEFLESLGNNLAEEAPLLVARWKSVETNMHGLNTSFGS